MFQLLQRYVQADEQPQPIDVQQKNVGFRDIEVVQRPLKDTEGMSFFFKINGIPIFSAGSNWIPGDSFSAKMTSKRYTDWLQLLVDGGQNTVRVWGGGYYEPEVFYDLCDRLGIIVWQDLMFACAAYPADLLSFRKNVQREVTQIVQRLQHHACMAIIAGK